MFSRANLTGQVNSPAQKPHGKFRAASARRLHALLGVISAFNLLLLITTGLLLQHVSLFHLDDHMVGRTFLPASYRPQDGPEGVRADIVIADLHSGRILGTAGTAVLDIITLGWLIMLLTGLVMYSGRTNGRRKARFPDDRGPGSTPRTAQIGEVEAEGSEGRLNTGLDDLPKSPMSQSACQRCLRFAGKEIAAMYLAPHELHAALTVFGNLWSRGVRRSGCSKSLFVVEAYRCRRGHCHLACRGAVDLQRTAQSAIVLFEVMAEAAGLQTDSWPPPLIR